MENVKILLKMLGRFCDETQKESGCMTCPNYNLCSTETWEDAESELQEIDPSIEILRIE